tara:strand:- start:89 stop:358 length:270 start_codon:yes stop_codon:yes gene_type:complete
LLGKNNNKRGGVPIAMPEAKIVIVIVVITSFSRDRSRKAFLNSTNEGRFKDVYSKGEKISKLRLYSQINPIDRDSNNMDIEVRIDSFIL